MHDYCYEDADGLRPRGVICLPLGGLTCYLLLIYQRVSNRGVPGALCVRKKFQFSFQSLSCQTWTFFLAIDFEA